MTAPLELSSWPTGVTEVKVYRSGLSLVECRHEGLRDAEQPGGPYVRGCWFCRGDAQTTQGYTLPVKRLVHAPKVASLF